MSRTMTMSRIITTIHHLNIVMQKIQIILSLLNQVTHTIIRQALQENQLAVKKVLELINVLVGIHTLKA
jgi:hypothetical protein